MIVTLTSKGQLTLPKAIRDELKLDAGAQLDFVVDKDGSLRARPLRPLSSLFGLLHRPGMKPLSLADIDADRRARSAEEDRVKNESTGRKKTAGRPAR